MTQDVKTLLAIVAELKPDHAMRERERWLIRLCVRLGEALKATQAVGCTYPDCDCAISFPDGYKPSEATECPRCATFEPEDEQ